MNVGTVNSADSHVLEPSDLWTTHLPPKLRDRGPRSVTEHEREVVYLDNDIIRRERPFPDRPRPNGAFDPQARMIDLEHEGVWGELLFPSLGLWLYQARDAELVLACAQVYNDWLLESFERASPRFVGVGLIPIVLIADAVAEVERTAAAGYRAVLLPTSPPRPYNDVEHYERLWSAIEAAGMVACFHVGTGADPVVARGPGGAVINYAETFFPAQRTVIHLVASGTLDNHRGLQVVIVEGGASWLPGVMERMDEAFDQHRSRVRPELSARPSEIVRRQIHATFQHDRALLATLEITGLEAVLWGSDYPHLEGTFPRTRETLDELFEGVAPAIRAAVTGGTAARLFRIPDPQS